MSASPPATGPSPAVSLTGWLLVLWCLGFAAINVVYEVTGRFSSGPYADFRLGFGLMNWLVAILKVFGAVIALAVISRRQILPSPVTRVLVWGAFATIALYALGSSVEAVGILAGLTPGQITVANATYLLFFLLGATGYGVLAVSHSRRFDLPTRLTVAGILGGPLMLGLVLAAVPMLVTGLGLLPATAP